MTYSSSDILSHEEIQLSQGGMILIGVLRGGDYSEGLHGCGIATAHGLAKAGFGDSLLQAARTLSRDDLEDFLVGWRKDICHELKTNSSGRLQRKSPALAKTITEDFPDIDVVLAYTNPVTSEAKGAGHKNAVVDWDKEPDLGKIAGLCEMYFEWGLKHIIIKRFRTVLWPSAVLRILRRAALIKDRKAAAVGARDPVTPRKCGKEHRAPPGTPSSMITKHFARITLNTPRRNAQSERDSDDEDDDGEGLIVTIHSSRRHASTDNVLEYRLEIAPAQLVRLCEAGIRGLRTELPPDLSDSEDDDDDDDDSGGTGKKGKKKSNKPPPDPTSHVRIWMPACMVAIVEPQLVDEFEGIQRQKAEKKAAKDTKAKKSAEAGGKAKKTKLPAVTAIAEEEEESGSDSDVPPPPPKPRTTKAAASAPKTSRTKAVATAVGKPTVDKVTAVAGPSKINGFFPAKKTTTVAADRKAKKVVSNAAKVADLFKDIPPLGSQSSALDAEQSSDDGLPHPSHLAHVPYISTSTSSTMAGASKSASSRLLSFLDSRSSVGAQSASVRSPLKSCPTKSSPSKERVLRPFPMEFDMFKEDEPPTLHPMDEEMFTANVASKTSASARTRAYSSLSTDADAPPSKQQLQKSPRRSEKHSSPRKTPTKGKQPSPREEEESSDDDDVHRPPSPSPLKGRQPMVLGSRLSYPGRNGSVLQREEEEQSDRAPSPSPMRRKVLPMTSNRPPRPTAPRKPAPFPADLSIISISSDSDTEPPPLKSNKVAPLQLAKARLSSNKTAVSPTTQPAQPPIAMMKPPRRTYDPANVIDLT